MGPLHLGRRRARIRQRRDVKLAIITGASAGIGEAAAAAFLQAGYAVVCLARRPCSLPQARSIACDLGDPEFNVALAGELDADLRAAESVCLIHNACLLENDRVGDTAADRLRHIFEINLVAPNTLNNLVLPHMGSGSSVLYVGSTLSEKAVPGSFSYVTSKHALIGMMRATCQDLAGRGIHTACVCPGFTDTAMLRAHVPAEALATVAAMSAFERLVEPEEIAALLLFTAELPALNGAVLHANLGQVER